MLKGGLSIEALPGIGERPESRILGENPYRYSLISLADGDSIIFELPLHFFIYVLWVSKNECIDLNGFKVPVDWCCQGDASNLSLSSEGGEALVLLASQPLSSVSNSKINYFSAESAKKVIKPWGHEIWLTGDPSEIFAVKKIHLKAGNMTSLQYHLIKRETNLIWSGKAEVYFNPDLSIPPEKFDPSMVDKIIVNGPTVVDVLPGFIHRLEAKSDITLYEVSTPELDDVIRIQDFSGRSNGRILNEHK
jgi:mannose-6-phosphate isomerase